LPVEYQGGSEWINISTKAVATSLVFRRGI
jgi:hypothetical protein